MKPVFILILFGFLASSCEKCKECYLEETNSATGEKTVTSIGQLCGDELDNRKTGNYTSNPNSRTFCQ